MPKNKASAREKNRLLLLSLKNVGSQPVILHTKYDPSINLSYQKAIQIAADHILGLSSDQPSILLDELGAIFEHWRDSHGVYPPIFKGGLRAVAENKKKQMPAKDYIEHLRHLPEDAQKIPIPKPWECCDLAKSPVELFMKLHREKHPPLVKFFRNESVGFDSALAASIILTHLTGTLSTDCIYGALELVHHKMTVLSDTIRTMKKENATALNRVAGRKAKASENKKETLKKVKDVYDMHGKAKTLKWIAHKAGITESTVSKYLKELGIDHKQNKK